MGLGDALQRLDRRVLGRHAEVGPLPAHPMRRALAYMAAISIFQFLGLLAMGFTLAEAVNALLTNLVMVMIGMPLVLLALRRYQQRSGDGRDHPPE